MGTSMKRKIEEKLSVWKQKIKNRKPIILNGARQVGKTYILKEFGKEHFGNVVYVNLEINRQVRSYFEENLEPKQILRYLEAVAGEKIIPEKRSLFLMRFRAVKRH